MSSEYPYYMDKINKIWYYNTNTYFVSRYGFTYFPVSNISKTSFLKKKLRTCNKNLVGLDEWTAVIDELSNKPLWNFLRIYAVNKKKESESLKGHMDKIIFFNWRDRSSTLFVALY